MVLYNIKKVFNPDWFQGNGKSKNYFEGWYFKVVSGDGMHTWSFIPGIAFGKSENHCFIQVINGTTGQTWYFRYDAKDFRFSRNSFKTDVAGSSFSGAGFSLNIKENDGLFKGEIVFRDLSTFPVSLFRPGIMGWYRYVPFMECYHGVVSMDHELQGVLNLNGSKIDFTGGKGYIEKDWGSSMPQAWIWMQTNHFGIPKTSFMLSVARIPWIGSAFTGFLGFMLHQGQLYPFATYTGAKIDSLSADGEWVEVLIRAKRFSILVRGKNSSRGALKAPAAGEMDRVIHESVNAELSVTLYDQRQQIIFEGKGKNAGLELVGDIELLAD